MIIFQVTKGFIVGQSIVQGVSTKILAKII